MKSRFETLEEELLAIDCMADSTLIKYYGTSDRSKIEEGVINWWRTQISENEIKEALLLIKELKETEV